LHLINIRELPLSASAPELCKFSFIYAMWLPETSSNYLFYLQHGSWVTAAVKISVWNQCNHQSSFWPCVFAFVGIRPVF